MAGRNLFSSTPKPQSTRARNLFAAAPEVDVAMKQPGVLASGAIAAGEGIMDMGRTLGFIDPADPTQVEAMDRLRQAHPTATSIGRLVGQAMPFALVPVGAIQSTAGRIAAGATLGGVEGAIVAGANKQNVAEGVVGGTLMGGVSEAILPPIIRAGSKLIRKVFGKAPKMAVVLPNGSPSPELEDALAATGQSYDDFVNEAKNLLGKQAPGTDLDQAVRLAQFADVGVKPLKGDITQDFAQQTAEARLFESAADPISDSIRTARLEQSNVIRSKLDDLVESLGVPEDVGPTIKNALESKKTLLRQQKDDLYAYVGKKAKNIGGIPFVVDSITDAIPDDATIKRLQRLQGTQVNAALDLLAEFGIDYSDEAVERLRVKKITPIQLGLHNYEDFRVALNNIMRADPTHTVDVILQPVKHALDAEADSMANMLTKSRVSEDIIKPLKEARATVAELKTNFNPKNIVGRLIETKKDRVTPLIEASKVYKEVAGIGMPIERLERTVRMLRKSGPEGEKAISSLQAATVADLIEASYKAQTRKVQGVKTFGSTAFQNRMARIGDDKLKLIFSNRPDVYKDLKKIEKVAYNLTPPSGAVPKGSANAILDTLRRLGVVTIMGKIPGGGVLAEGLTMLSKNYGNRRAVEKALAAKPDMRQTLNFIQRQMPTIATAFGVAEFMSEDEQNATNN